MGFKQNSGGNQVPPVYATFNAATGDFRVACEAGAEGAIEHIIAKGENAGKKTYYQSHKALEGKLMAVKTREETFMGSKSIDVNMAFEDPEGRSKPTIIVKARLMGGDKQAVGQATLGMIEALCKADPAKVVSLSVVNNPAGSTFTNKEGKEITRELASSTVFVREEGMDKKEFLRDDRDSRPEAPTVKVGSIEARDYGAQLAYGLAKVAELTAKTDTERNRVKDLLADAHKQPPAVGDDQQFGQE